MATRKKGGGPGSKKKSKPKTRTVHYAVLDYGDGSAHPKFFSTEAAAEKYEESVDEGLCDSTGSLKLVVGEDGLPYIEKLEWNGKKHNKVLI